MNKQYNEFDSATLFFLDIHLEKVLIFCDILSFINSFLQVFLSLYRSPTISNTIILPNLRELIYFLFNFSCLSLNSLRTLQELNSANSLSSEPVAIFVKSIIYCFQFKFPVLADGGSSYNMDYSIKRTGFLDVSYVGHVILFTLAIEKEPKNIGWLNKCSYTYT